MNPSDPVRPRPDPIAALVEQLIAIYGMCVSQSTDLAVRNGAHPGEECSRLFSEAIDAALRADADARRVQEAAVSCCESARPGENTKETQRTHGADADARPPQKSSDRAELLRNLKWIKEFAEGHHAQESSGRHLHSLTIDIPHYLDYAIAILDDGVARRAEPPRWTEDERMRIWQCLNGLENHTTFELRRKARTDLERVLGVNPDATAAGRAEPLKET